MFLQLLFCPVPSLYRDSRYKWSHNSIRHSLLVSCYSDKGQVDLIPVFRSMPEMPLLSILSFLRTHCTASVQYVISHNYEQVSILILRTITLFSSGNEWGDYKDSRLPSRAFYLAIAIVRGSGVLACFKAVASSARDIDTLGLEVPPLQP
jgi:hypothetical protein